MIPKNQKGEPKAPPFLWADLILAIASAVYAGGGFGHRFVSDSAFIIALIVIIFSTPKRIAGIVAIVLGLCLYQQALMENPTILGALFFVVSRPKHGILVLLGSVIQMIGWINPYYIPIALTPVVLLCSLNRWKRSSPTTAITAVALLVLNLLPTLLPLNAPTGHQGFAFPYRIDVASRLSINNAKYSYSSIDDHGNVRDATVLVLEHDPPHGLATHNWSQKRLWRENYYFGAPLYRIAVGLDGFLYSNLGARVSEANIRLLGEAHSSEHNSFISRKKNKTVFSDSDFLNNGSVGYQKHLNDALFKKFSLSHAILLSSVLAFILALFPRSRMASLPTLIIFSTAACVFLHNQKIDIRISDNRPIWPHSKGISGIGSEINEETGIVYVSKYGNARILGIARDSSSTYDGEKVVVMEGGSRINIGNLTYEALDLPMGEADGIVNAIPIRLHGSDKSRSPDRCLLRVNNVTLIGTNSARLNSQKIYAAAK